MIFQLRQYDIHPGKMSAWLDVFEAHHPTPARALRYADPRRLASTRLQHVYLAQGL